jgi:hypothetical protein
MTVENVFRCRNAVCWWGSLADNELTGTVFAIAELLPYGIVKSRALGGSGP